MNNGVQIVKYGAVGEPNPMDVTIDGGSPLYHLLLEDPNATVTRSNEVHAAKNRLSSLIRIDCKKVLSCRGLTREKAREILDSIEEQGSSQPEERAA